MAWLLLVALLLAASCRPAEKAVAPPPEPPNRSEALALADSLARRRQALTALCQLASLAAPSAPDLALAMYDQAMLWGQEALQAPAGQMAARLAVEAADQPAPVRRESLALAQRLQDLGGAAWPLGLVADGAQVVSPALAERALNLALDAVQANSNREQRQRDLGGLALLAARQSPARGERLAAQVEDPGLKAWVLRDLAARYDSPANRQAALAAAQALEDPGARALALARLALAALATDVKAGHDILDQAMAATGKIPQAAARALTQGEVAALAAQTDPNLGLSMAARVEAWPGAKIKALRLASAQLLPSDPNRARAGLEAAWREAQFLPLIGQRSRIQSLLVRDMAPLDPRRGREMLRELPPESQTRRSEAAAALVLALAGRSLSHALEQARGLPLGESRVLLLTRLAGLALKQGDDQGRAVLEEATTLASLIPSDQLAQALALAWAKLDPSRALALAQGLADPATRVKTLLAVAKTLAEQGETAASQWGLRLAEMALTEMSSKEGIDKVRLMGHMGREWATVETAKSRRFFQQGVETATQLGESSKGPGS